MPRKDVSFYIELGANILPETLNVCATWINKRGSMTSTNIKNNKCIIKFTTIKFVVQNNLLRSLRTAFQKKHITDEVHIYCCPLPTTIQPTREQLESRIERLEERVNGIASRPETIINNTNNNFIILNNFGSEDFSHLSDPREYLEQRLGGLRNVLKDAFFNDDQGQNHTARLNMKTKEVEVHQNGAWVPTVMSLLTDRMIGKCRTFIIQGFDPLVHMADGDVCAFIKALSPVTVLEVKAPMLKDISDGLVARHTRQVQTFNSEYDEIEA